MKMSTSFRKHDAPSALLRGCLIATAYFGQTSTTPGPATPPFTLKVLRALTKMRNMASRSTQSPVSKSYLATTINDSTYQCFTAHPIVCHHLIASAAVVRFCQSESSHCQCPNTVAHHYNIARASLSSISRTYDYELRMR